MSCECLALGRVYLDLIFAGAQSFPAPGEEVYARELAVLPGGGAFHVVAALRRLGKTARLAAFVGEDPVGALLRGLLRQEGVEQATVLAEGHPRNVTVALSAGGERSFVSYCAPQDEGAWVRLLEQALRRHRPRHVHLAALPGVARLSRVARAAGCTVSLDPAGLGAADLAGGTADLLLPNRREATRLTGEEDPGEACRRLGERFAWVAVTLDREGAVGCHAGESVRVGALATRVVDATAAGDCFDAGFLLGFLEGDPLQRCLALGNACAAGCLGGYGSEAAPDRRTVEERLR